MILVHRFLGEDGKVRYQLHLTLPTGETIKSPLIEKGSGRLGEWAICFLELKKQSHFSTPSPSKSKAG